MDHWLVFRRCRPGFAAGVVSGSGSSRFRGVRPVGRRTLVPGRCAGVDHPLPDVLHPAAVLPLVRISDLRGRPRRDGFRIAIEQELDVVLEAQDLRGRHGADVAIARGHDVEAVVLGKHFLEGLPSGGRIALDPDRRDVVRVVPVFGARDAVRARRASCQLGQGFRVCGIFGHADASCQQKRCDQRMAECLRHGGLGVAVMEELTAPPRTGCRHRKAPVRCPRRVLGQRGSARGGIGQRGSTIEIARQLGVQVFKLAFFWPTRLSRSALTHRTL